jgi:hypothetical protein
MADTLPPVVIELRLQVEQMQQQLKAVTGQLESVGRQAQTATAPVAGLGGAFTAVAGAAAGLLAGVEVVKFLSDSAQAAVTSGKSFNLMALQMQNSTGATREQSKAIDDQLEKMSLATGTLMPELRDSYSTLVRNIGNTTEALKYEQLAQNISAATGRDLNLVSLALARSHEGNWMALNKMIPGVKDATDKMKFLQDATKGAAEEAAKSDPYARLKAAMESIQVSVGQAFLPVLQSLADALANIAPKITDMMNAFVASPQFQSFVNSLPGIVDFLGQLADQIFPILSDLGSIVGTVFDSLAGDFDKIGNSSSSVITLFADIRSFFDWLAQAIAGLQKWNDAINGLLDGLAKLGPFSQGLSMIIKQLIDPIGSLLGMLDKLNAGLHTADETSAAILAREKGASNWVSKPAWTPPKGGGGGGDSKTSAAATTAQQMAAALAAFNQAVLAEQAKYNNATATATNNHNNKINDITASATTKLQSIIAASKALLTDAFKKATAVDTGSMFLDAGANINNFMTMLKDKLTGAKKLADDTAKLAGLGYSQEFIQSIVSQGGYVGDALAQQLIAGGPEQAAALQAQMDELNKISAHGADQTANDLMQKSGLANEDLKNQFAQAQQDLVSSLTAENKAYADSLTQLVKDYEVAMAKMQITRDQAAIKALQVGGVTKAEAKQIAAYNKDIAAENAVIANNTTVNVTASTNASPSQIAQDVVNAIKFNAPVSVGA